MITIDMISPDAEDSESASAGVVTIRLLPEDSAPVNATPPPALPVSERPTLKQPTIDDRPGSAAGDYEIPSK